MCISNGPSTSTSTGTPAKRRLWLSPKLAFLLVSLSLGQLGDGLNIFQGIYLVSSKGWNEGSVGIALSLMGLTSLAVQPWAGDWVDKTTVDRRIFLAGASLATAASASTILLVRDGNRDHGLIFATKVGEGVASSFLGPCLAALTLATFGPHHFDAVMASNIMWGHIGSVAAAVLAGGVSYVMFPNIKTCFLVIGASALVACFFVRFLPQGDPLMGRGFAGRVAMDEEGRVEQLESAESDDDDDDDASTSCRSTAETHANHNRTDGDGDGGEIETPVAASYMEVFADTKSVILCFTGFFFHFANANVLLVLGEMMGRGDKGDDGNANTRNAIPLVAGAIVTAQITMAAATYVGDKLTLRGVGRKPLFLAALASLPVRCALIVRLKDAGDAALLSTQILDGIGGGLMGLVQPYLVADITFGTGRFNVLMGVIASAFGLGATLSNYIGQMVVEKFDHVTSLTASLVISLIPVVLFLFMPETLGARDHYHHQPRGSTPEKPKYQQVALRMSPVETETSSSYGSFDA